MSGLDLTAQEAFYERLREKSGLQYSDKLMSRRRVSESEGRPKHPSERQKMKEGLPQGISRFQDSKPQIRKQGELTPPEVQPNRYQGQQYHQLLFPQAAVQPSLYRRQPQQMFLYPMSLLQQSLIQRQLQQRPLFYQSTPQVPYLQPLYVQIPEEPAYLEQYLYPQMQAGLLSPGMIYRQGVAQDFRKPLYLQYAPEERFLAPQVFLPQVTSVETPLDLSAKARRRSALDS